LNDEAVIKIKN